MPDGMCSLRGAEIGNSAGFNPAMKKNIFYPTNSMKSSCVSVGLPSGHLCPLQCYWKCLSLEKSGQRNGGNFWEGHRPSSASDEGYGRDF